MKKIGLIGGVSWASTIDYYRFINIGINERLGRLNFAECLIYSLNVGDVMDKGWINSFDLLHNACQNLKQGGADAIVLCANSAHFHLPNLEKEIDLPIINVIKATAAEIEKLGIKKIGLLGTKFTMEMDFYINGLKEFNLVTIIPSLEETRDFIQQTLRDELGAGIVKEETRKAYISIINDLINDGAEGIILGCTEIPMIIKQSDISAPIFDTTKIHSQAAIEFALSE